MLGDVRRNGQQPPAGPDDGRIWAYRAGGAWEEVPDPVPLPEEQLLSAAEVEALRAEAGFHFRAAFGHEAAQLSMTLYAHEEGARFLAEILLGEGVQTVLLESVPALLEFTAKFLPAVAAVAALEGAGEGSFPRRRG
jgi:hypothetical protein